MAPVDKTTAATPFRQEEQQTATLSSGISVAGLQAKVRPQDEEDRSSASTGSFSELDGVDGVPGGITDEQEVDATPSHPPSNFRLKYIQKLAGVGAYVPLPRRLPVYHTVTVFDWDDTLLCTSWLYQSWVRRARSWFGRRRWRPDEATVQDLDDIQEQAMALLDQALRWGPTFIVTNAAAVWVHESAKMWAPFLSPMLEKVTVISARDGYEGEHPVGRWKAEAFLELQRKLPEMLVTNLIVIGDSEHEMTAARIMRSQFEHALLKAVKFTARPTPIQLLAQLQVVSRSFGKIASETEDVRIDLYGGRR
mmetsp:Transcript_32983/g.94734  ORF Transcript_32983/g.94734 Transcript_32983/m.94734 type:complete len:308 (-) Transcript_32983:242-1165(-)